MSGLKPMHVMRSIHFSYYASQAVLQPMLPLYFAHSGYTPQQIGSLMVLGPFIAILAQPLWGWVSDFFQAVKPLLLSLWIMAALSAVGLFSATEFQFSLLFSVIFQFCLLSAIPLLDSITLQTTEANGSSYGAVRLWGSAGYTLSAAASGMLLVEVGGISKLYVLYMPLGVLAVGFAVLMRRPAAVPKKISLSSMGQLLAKPPFIRFLLLVLLISTGHRMHDTFFSLYMQKLDAGSQMISWAWAIAAACEIPTFALMGRLLSRYNGYALLTVISSLYALRWVLLSVIGNPVILMVLQVLHAVTFPAFWATVIFMMVKQIPAEMRSTGQAMLSAVYMGLAGLLGGTIGGSIMDQAGGPAMYRLAAVISCAAILLSAISYVMNARGKSQRRGVQSRAPNGTRML